MKKELAEYALTHALKEIKQIIDEIKKDGFENEQFYLDFLDELNAISTND